MSRKPFWVGEHLVNLLSKSLDELCAMYPQFPRNQLGVSKKYWTKQMEKAPENSSNIDKFRELLERSGIDPENIEQIKEIKAWQGFIKNSEGEIEYADLTGVSVIPKRDEVEASFISQAEPVRITPSRAKAPKRDYRLIVAFGDAQIAYRKIGEELVPIHDERAMRVARLICKDLRPETIVNLGDNVDLPQLSKYDPDSNHFVTTMQEGFNRAHSYYAELRADNPTSRIVEVDSNHNVRLGKFVLKQAMQFYGLRQAGVPEQWPILTYPFIANLESVGVEWFGGYGAAQFEYAPDLVFKHGDKIRSNGSTADLQSKENPYNNIVVGHGHKAQTHTRTTPDGRYLTAVQVATLCKTTGEVPGYGTAVDDWGNPVHKQMDWQNGLLVIEDYGDGHYNFFHVLIQDGKAYYQGKEYNGNER